MLVECFSNVCYTLANSGSIIILVEIADHYFYFVVPGFLAELLVNAFISEYCELVIFHGNIQQHGVTVGSLIHLQPKKYFGRLVNCVNILAAAFYVYTYLATRAMFCVTHSINNQLPFFRCEE